jgi:hypothetical protein
LALPLQVPVGSVQLAETLVYVPVVAAYPDQFVLSAWWRMPPRAFGTAAALIASLPLPSAPLPAQSHTPAHPSAPSASLLGAPGQPERHETLDPVRALTQ